jgi:serine protease Do
MGSGIIMDAEGHILTNNHVVDGVDEINVTLPDKRTFEVEVVGTDPKTDLAVLKIKGKTPKDLPVAKLGDSDKGRVGDWVLAFGAPFGYEQTVTAGIISAKGRGNVGVADYEDFIQTDAAINPGNSGGPLVNMDGEVIGINTAIATRVGQYAGVGFAIPINMIKSIMPALVKGESVKRGMLGVVIQPVDPDMAKQFGVDASKGALVAQVNPDSAASKAGVKVGDIIQKYDGKEVQDVRSLRNMVAATKPGSKIELVVLRDGKEKKLAATVGELTADDAASTGSDAAKDVANLGMSVEPLTTDKAKQLGLKDEQGVLVSAVQDNGAAATAGIQPGDLVIEVNREKVTSVAEFRNAAAKSKDKESVLMFVKREGSSRFVIVKPSGD